MTTIEANKTAMEKLYYTPGPWRAVEKAGSPGVRDIRSDPGDHWVGGAAGRSVAEQNANARLMAAAPELLCELREDAIVFARLAELLDSVLTWDGIDAGARGKLTEAANFVSLRCEPIALATLKATSNLHALPTPATSLPQFPEEKEIAYLTQQNTFLRNGCARLETEKLELLAALKALVALGVHRSCFDLHHGPKDQHSGLDPCPVEKRAEAAVGMAYAAIAKAKKEEAK